MGLLMRLVLTAVLPALNFGMLLSSLNSCMNFVIVAFDICGSSEDSKFYETKCTKRTLLEQLLTAVVFLGAAVGSMLGSPCNERFGRAGAMIKVNFFMLAFFILSAVTPNIYGLMVARFFLGIGIGCTSVCVPCYIAEMSPAESRGSYGVCNQIAITVGIFLSVAVGLLQTQAIDWRGNDEDLSNGLVLKTDVTDFDLSYWRFVVSMGIVPALLNIFLFGVVYRMFESPVWLVKKGRTDQARRVLIELRGANMGEAEHAQLVQNQERATGSQNKGFCEALGSNYHKVAIMIGCGLSAFQQFTGINVIISQSNTMFQSMVEPSYVTLMSSVVDAVNVLLTFVALYVIDTYGRRTLVVNGCIGMACSMTLAFLAVVLDIAKGPLVIISVFMFICCFACTYGPCVWVYLAEIYPSNVRSSAVAGAIAINWVASAVVVFGIGTVLETCPEWVAYLIFSVLNVMGFCFTYTFMVETKGSSIEESPMYIGRKHSSAMGLLPAA